MKAKIKATDSLWFDVEAEQEDELFKQIARVQEIFQHRGCGHCQSPNVKFVCRLDSSDNDWLSWYLDVPKREVLSFLRLDGINCPRNNKSNVLMKKHMLIKTEDIYRTKDGLFINQRNSPILRRKYYAH